MTSARSVVSVTDLRSQNRFEFVAFVLVVIDGWGFTTSVRKFVSQTFFCDCKSFHTVKHDKAHLNIVCCFCVCHSDILRVGVTLAGHQKKILNSVQMMRAQMNQIQSVEVWPSWVELRGERKAVGMQGSGCGGWSGCLFLSVFLVCFSFFFSRECVWSSHQTTIHPPSPRHFPRSFPYPYILNLPPSLGSAVESCGKQKPCDEASEVPQPTHLWSQKRGRLEVTSNTFFNLPPIFVWCGAFFLVCLFWSFCKEFFKENKRKTKKRQVACLNL